MRNLKKFLALVLAMMMVFGLMVTANAAPLDGYRDADDVNDDYLQAMEVIAELGVLKGYSDTVLAPTEVLKREQLAAILYRISTGNTTAAKEEKDALLGYMKETKVFDDVPAGQWYTGYINYANSNGWLTGYNGKVYGLGDDLTVIQVLTGVMRVLKLEVESTGNWAMDTLIAANKYKLLGGFDAADLGGTATREMAAQLALNALTYDPANVNTGKYRVTITKTGSNNGMATFGPNGTTPNAVFVALDGKDFESFAEAILNVTLIEENAELNKHYTVAEVIKENKSLGADKFSLSTSDIKYDPYGRPITAYTVDNVLISYAVKGAKMNENTTISGSDLYSTLGVTANGLTATIVPFVTSILNSENGTGYSGTPNPRYTVDTTSINNKADTTPYGGNGVTVEIYSENAKTNTWRAVVIVPVLAEVTNIRSYRETATEGAYTEYTLDNISVPLRIYSSKKTDNDWTNLTVNGSVSRGDYVIVDTIKVFDPDGEIGEYLTSYEITPVSTVTGAITRYAESTETYTIGGRSYLKSGIINWTDLNAPTVDSQSHTFALDADGNVVAQLPDNTVSANYIFTLSDEVAYYYDGNKKMEEVVEVTGINQNGELVVLPVNNWYYGPTAADVSRKPTTATIVNEGTDNQVMLYAYDAASGKYNLWTVEYLQNVSSGVSVAQRDAADKVVVPSLAVGATDLRIDNTTYLVGAGATVYTINSVYANLGTKYYVASTDKDDEYVDVKSYVGYNSIGNISTSASGKMGAVIDLDGDGIADIVYVDAYTATKKTPYAFILPYYVTEDDDTYTYNAYVDGELAKVNLDEKVPANILPALMAIDEDGVASLIHESIGAVDGDGNLIATGVISGINSGNTVVLYNNLSRFSYKGGSLVRDAAVKGASDTIVALEVKSDVPVYVFSNGDLVETLKVSEMKSLTGAVMVFVSDGDKSVSAIYIDEDAAWVTEGEFDAGDREVPSVTSGEEIVLSGTATLTVMGDIEQGADITTDSFDNIHVVGNCEEAITFDGDDGSDPHDADPGMLFVMDGAKAESNSEEGRTEYCLVFETDGTHDTVIVTLTNGKRTLVMEDSGLSTSTRYYELICPDELNDRSLADHETTTGGNKFYEGNTYLTTTTENNKNKLEAGYWTVTITCKGAASNHPALFTGGFTVK